MIAIISACLQYKKDKIFLIKRFLVNEALDTLACIKHSLK